LIGVEHSTAPGVVLIGGRDSLISLDSYCPPQAGQPPASKVLSCHSQPSSLGAWRLGDIRQADRNFCTRQQQEKPKETSSKTGLLERPDYAEQSLKTSRTSATPGKLPSSTTS